MENCKNVTKGGVIMKYFVSFLLLILLTSCSNNEESGGDKVETKEITLQVIDNQDDDQRYLINIMTNGKQTKDSAVLPKSILVITNDKKEVKGTFYLNTKYTLKVSKTDSKTMKEFHNKKKGGQVGTEQLITTVDFSPTKDTSTFEINVKE
jgi:hypothetical protein